MVYIGLSQLSIGYYIARLQHCPYLAVGAGSLLGDLANGIARFEREPENNSMGKCMGGGNRADWSYSSLTDIRR